MRSLRTTALSAVAAGALVASALAGADRARRRGALARPQRHQRDRAPPAAAEHRHRQRRQPRHRPTGLQGLARLGEGQARRGRLHDPGPVVLDLVGDVVQPRRRLAGRRPRARRDDRRAPRQRLGRARASTTTAPAPRRPRGRARLGRAAATPRATTCASRGGARRSRACSAPTSYMSHAADRRQGPHRPLHELRHGRLAQPRLLRLRRQRRRQRRPRHDDRLLHVEGHPLGVHRRAGPLRPRVVPQLRHRHDRHVLRRRGHQDLARRRRSGAARPARRSTPATTARATPSPTSTAPRWTATST